MLSNQFQRPIVAFFDSLGHHPYRLLSGIRQVLEPLGWPLLVYVGGKLAPEVSSHRHANQVFDLLDSDSIAGIIVYTGGLADELTTAQVHAFFERYRPLPLVSIAYPVPGVPSILVDNEAGMRAMMHHLIRQRGFRRFAFLQGIEGHDEANQREAVVRQELAAHGINLDPALVARADFHGRPAGEAVRRWLAEGRTFDVVVAANDDMAYGAMFALNEKNLNVPFDVAVTGFDDSPVSRLVTPALTTVRQPVVKQGGEAARTLLALIAGEQVGFRRTLVMELVVRGSCGVQATEEGQRISACSGNHLDRCVARLAALPDRPSGLPTNWAETLLGHFFRDIKTPVNLNLASSFLRFTRKCVQASAREEYTLNWWRNVFTTLYLDVVPELPKAQDRRSAAELCVLAQGLVQNALSSAERERILRSQGKDRVLVDFGQELVTQKTLQDVLQTVASHFRDFDITRAYIALYDENSQAPHEFLRLMLAYEHEHLLPCKPEPYPATSLLPKAFTGRLSDNLLIVHPLQTADKLYGLFLYEPNRDARADDQMQALDVLHHQLQQTLSTAVETALQRSALQAYTQGLEQIVEARTVQLTREVTERRRAEKALRKANDQLSQLAQLDGLTGLANRRTFDTYLVTQWQRHGLDSAPLTMILCDIDAFKRYNDHYGHLQGDACLKQVAQTLKGRVRRAEDLVARYGGEEFVILLPRTDLQGGVMLAETIRQRVVTLALPHQESPHQIITLSFGVASLVPGDERPEVLIQHADEALYGSKMKGRNCVSTHLPSAAAPV